MGIEIPEDLNGSGMPFTSAIIVIEELAKVDPAIRFRTLDLSLLTSS